MLLVVEDTQRLFCALTLLNYSVKAIYDDNPIFQGQSLMGVPIVGPVEQVMEDAGLLAVLATGDNLVRRALARKLNLEWLSVIDPRAQVDPTVHVGHGTVVLPGAIVQIDSWLGDHVIINTSVTVDHDCVIGDFCHVAPGVNLAGGVILGEGTMVGIGAAVIPCVRIGKWSVIGAGATVVGDIIDGVVAVGTPASPIKNCNPDAPKPDQGI